MGKLASLFCVLVLAARVTIAVDRPVLMAGYSVTVTCRVQRMAENRWLEVGIEDVGSSGVQLEGELSRMTYSIRFDRVPCEAGAAYCLVSRSDDSHDSAQLPLTIAGCEGF